MKKKILYILACSLVIMCLFGCGQTDSGSAADESKESMPAPDVVEAVEQTESSDDAETADVGASSIADVDLTSLSSTFVYAEVYNMMTNPGDYKGKTICMEGAFSHYHDDTTGKDYYACIIQDATACCSQGIEFELEGEYKYPEDYPADGAMIKVEGIFDTYMEGDSEYCTLRNAHML